MAEPINDVRLGYHYKVEARGYDTPCWVWALSRSANGYGRLTRKGKTLVAHRWVFERLRGPIPRGMTLDHLCRVVECVNPNHLEITTMRENILRGTAPSAVNAQKTECKNGHPFTPENTYHHSRGDRQCKVCKRDWNRKKAQERRSRRKADAELLRRERDEARADRDERESRRIDTEYDLVTRLAAAEADATALAEALRTMYGIHQKALAPHDRCRDKADRALAAHDARVSHNHGGSGTDDERGARNHPPETVAIAAHTPPFDSVRDEGRRP